MILPSPLSAHHWFWDRHRVIYASVPKGHPADETPGDGPGRAKICTVADLHETDAVSVARLIESAPDLLAACLTFVRAMEIENEPIRRWKRLEMARAEASDAIRKAIPSTTTP